MSVWDHLKVGPGNFGPRPEKPFLGDIHFCDLRDVGKYISEITDFEVWDGQRWVHGRDGDQEINIQLRPFKQP